MFCKKCCWHSCSDGFTGFLILQLSLHWIHLSLKYFFHLLILERERNNFCHSNYLCIHWLLLVCALTGDWTCNLGISGQCCNQLSYLTRAGFIYSIFFKFLFLFIFRERWREGEDRERNTNQLPLTHTPTRDLACNPGMCSNWESN